MLERIGIGIHVRMAVHPWSLDDAEFNAVTALQRDEPAPPRDDPVRPSLVQTTCSPVSSVSGNSPRGAGDCRL
jgi:hypothetical protein